MEKSVILYGVFYDSYGFYIQRSLFGRAACSVGSGFTLRFCEKKTLYDNDVKSVEIIDGGSVLERMSELNNNGDGAFFVHCRGHGD